MFIAIIHDIHNPELFQECAKEVFPLPDELNVLQFFPAPDGSRAVCLYDAPSVEKLSSYLDTRLNPASKQYYFPVLTEQSIGLPENVKA
jgi:hypothetical protein